MPQVTIGAAETVLIGTGDPVPAVVGARKSLMICLISGDAYLGWTDTVSAAGADDAGIPLIVGVPIAMSGETFQFSAPLRAFSTAGGVVNYQELRHP